MAIVHVGTQQRVSAILDGGQVNECAGAVRPLRDLAVDAKASDATRGVSQVSDWVLDTVFPGAISGAQIWPSPVVTVWPAPPVASPL